jgi:hypothetical protein
MGTAPVPAPEIGALVQVRGRRWVVGDVETAEHSTLVGLQSVEDGRYGQTLEAPRRPPPTQAQTPCSTSDPTSDEKESS